MKIHFPGLNSVRFFAAMMVLISHIESFKAQANIPNLASIPSISAFGQVGVKIFFVLSGFLIAYLLLTERAVSGKINIASFYVRRILRIWPLYYLVAILGLWIVPTLVHDTFLSGNLHENFLKKSLLVGFMLPNILQYRYGHILGLGVLWTVGIEEQFYLFFPWLVRQSRSRFLDFILSLIIVIVLMKLLIAVLVGSEIASHSNSYILFSQAFLQFDSMLIGALFAVIAIEKPNVARIFFSKEAQLISIIVSLFLIVVAPSVFFHPVSRFYSVANVCYGIPFGILILNLALNNEALLRLRYHIFEIVGKWSYGMYMYHSFIVYFLVILLHRHYFMQNLLLLNLIIYTMSISLTLIVSYLSYTYVETWFLNRKKYFSTIFSDP